MMLNHRPKKHYHKTPLIFQMEAAECGAVSLAIICAYWGRHVPMEQMRIETDITRDGSNAKNIKQAAERLGLECHAYRKKAANLYSMEFPCIILWESCHFVVLEGFRGKHACVNDPAIGRRRLEMDEFATCYGNMIMTFRPTALFVKNRKKEHLFPLLKERMKSQKENLGMLFLLEALALSVSLLVPVLVQRFLDGEGASCILALLLPAIPVKFLATVRAAVKRRETEDRQRLFSQWQFVEKLLRLPINFYAQRYPGDLLNRVEANSNVNYFMTSGLSGVLWNIFAAFCCLSAMLCYSLPIALLGIAGKAVNIFLAKAGADTLSNIMLKEQQDDNKVVGALHSGIRCYATLQATGTQAAYSSQLVYLETEHIKSRKRLEKIQGRTQTVSDIVSGIFAVTLLAKGMADVGRGKLTPGGLTACMLLYQVLSGQLARLSELVGRTHTVRADLEKVNDIMAYAGEAYIGQCETGKSLGKLSGDIACERISFGYSHFRPPLIADFSFHVQPGEMVAVVGMSGSGKSTVSKLLSGLYAPWSGKLRFDGRTTNECQSDVFYASIAVVCQDSMLFSGTVRDNITLWNTAILDSDVVEAAKDACIHDLITQKQEAYDYQIAENGANLSGGQKQRLEIARALAKNPTILIMDEATSALDTGTEKKILDNVRRRGCTCIMVAHRLSAVKDCDQIIVLKDGRIAESGTHTELLAHGGEYRRLIEME